MRSKLVRSAALIAALLVPSLASAGPGHDHKPGDAPAEAKPGAPALTEAEVHLLTELHATNGMEIEMGTLAKARGGSKAVKSYGQTLITDHTKADKDVLALAKSRGVTLADHPTPRDDAERAQMDKDMATMAKLKTLEGAAFDAEFAAAMVDGHSRTIAKVKAGQGAAADAKLKALLTKLLPTLEKHLAKAKALPAPKAPAAP